MRPRNAAGLLVCCIMLAAAAHTGAQETEFRGAVEEMAGLTIPLDGSATADFGSASTLDGALEISEGSFTIRLAGRLSILYGSRAAYARAALSLDPDSRIGVLTSPGFDPAAYDPTVPDTSWFTTLSLSEAVLSLSAGSIAAEAGKTIVNWGVGTAFSPADFFSDIDYSGGSPARRSSLIGRLSWFPGAVSRVELAVEPFSAQGATYAARGYSITGDSLAVAIEAGFRQGSPSRFLAALELSADIPVISPYMELATFYALDGSGDLTFKAMAGAQSRIGDLSLVAEYAYDAASASAHRAFIRAALPLGDWVSIALPAIIDFSQGSFSSGLIVSVPDLQGISLSLSASAARSAAGSWSAGADLSARASF